MKRILLILMLVLSVGIARAQMLTLKTDVAMDAAWIPNVGVDFVTGGKTSVGLTAFGSLNVWGNRCRTLGAMPEFRYWFNGRPMTRFFVGASLIGVVYDMQWGDEIYKGDALGGGMIFGYDFQLSRHWNLELHAGVAAIGYAQHHYYEGDRFTDVAQYKTRGYALTPYQLGVSFIYIIK